MIINITPFVSDYILGTSMQGV